MMLHHDKHHRSYVEGLNKAEDDGRSEKTNQFDLIKHWEKKLLFMDQVITCTQYFGIT